MAKKLNSKSQAGVKVDYEIKPIVTTSADIEANPMLYAVLKLNTDIEVTNPFTGKREDIKVGGIAGYIPVFNTVEEAQKSSQDGKYSIVAISPAQRTTVGLCDVALPLLIEKQMIMICTSADRYSGQYCKTPCWQFVPGI